MFHWINGVIENFRQTCHRSRTQVEGLETNIKHCKIVSTNAGVQEVHIELDKGGDVQKLTRVAVTFELSKGLFIRREQFPIVPAYAITIHKSQSLTLDSAIMSLGEEVFASGMAYVALSRVRSLDGVHLVKMEPLSILVDKNSLREYNRLRAAFRNDLPQFDIAKVNRRKRPKPTMTGTVSTSNAAVKLQPSDSFISSNLKRKGTLDDIAPKSKRRDVSDKTAMGAQKSSVTLKRKASDSKVSPVRKKSRRGDVRMLGLKNLLSSRKLRHPQTCYLNACLQCLSRTKIGGLIAELRHEISEGCFPLCICCPWLWQALGTAKSIAQWKDCGRLCKTKILSCSVVARRTCGMRLTLSCSTLTNVSAICSEKPFRLSAPVLTQRNDAVHVAALTITERPSHASFKRCALSK